MANHRLYYSLKPYLPWRLRIALRRWLARRKLADSPAWPIDPAAARMPDGWPGWPDGRRFAFVLTHDVEGPEGLARCRAIAQLEEEFGFRSSFNFIPEGSYPAPLGLMRWLRARGFEVGVHDLRHDGNLFRSRTRFVEYAARINRYLREWQAVGFRSGFMLRNLAWLHELEIAYDSSTFDTDPFEPQDEGAGTIFPLWVPPPAAGDAGPRRGYVELPYTLPQDSTLFLVLRETSPDIWLRKVDWVAAHGGMALLNVHPDYVQFDGPNGDRTYPAAHYRRLLEHVSSRYADACWHARAGDVARYVAQLPRPPVMRRRRRIAMVTYSFYESDSRVTRYAEALAARGDEVDVAALRRSPALTRRELIEGVRVFRLQDRVGKTEQRRRDFVWPLLRFLWRSTVWVTRRHAGRRYDLLHIHNMPDFLVFAGWYPRLTGTPVVLDIHDIVPEFYASKFRHGEKAASVALLRLVERTAARFATHIIISNDLWLERYAARNRVADKCSVFINYVDTRVFQPQPRTRRDDRLLILFPGGLHWHQGIDIALAAFRRIHAELPNAEFHIYGEGSMKPALVTLARQLGFNGSVKFFEPVRATEVARIMAEADVGIVPKRADSFGNEAYSTKIMEFMALGVPVVVSRTKVDQYYFSDSVVKFFESGDVDGLADAVIEILRDPDRRRSLVEAAAEYSRRHSWSQRKDDYLQIVDRLSEPAGGPNHPR